MLIANVFYGHCNKLTRTKVIPQQFIDCVWHPGQFHPTLARKDVWPLIKSDMWVLAMHFVSLKKCRAVGEFDKSDAMTQPVDACCKTNQQYPRLLWEAVYCSFQLPDEVGFLMQNSLFRNWNLPEQNWRWSTKKSTKWSGRWKGRSSWGVNPYSSSTFEMLSSKSSSKANYSSLYSMFSWCIYSRLDKTRGRASRC